MVTDIEAVVMRKVSARLVPLLGCCYLINLLDRFNISVAALTMNKSLGLSVTTYGLGAGCVWGVCSAGTAFATGVRSFVLARFVLGVAGAGFFPVAFYMT